MVGSRPLHAELEAELAAWKGTEAALLFPTGFAANLGLLATLGGPDVTILSDELNHASIVDGARLARADVRVYGHVDLDHLAKLLVDVDAAGRGPALVVTDSAFSMDGDVVDVAALVDVCAGHDALVVVDEAHAVMGPRVDLLAPRPTAASRCCAWGRCRRRSARSAASSQGPGATSTCSATAPARSSSRRPPRRPTSPPRSPRCGSSGRARVVTWWPRLRSHVDRLRPGHPTPIVPVVLGDEAAASRRRPMRC